MHFEAAFERASKKPLSHCCDAFGLYMQPLKVQYVILTASGWNGYSRTNSKYLRALFLLPSPQIWHSRGLPDRGHRTGTSAIYKRKETSLKVIAHRVQHFHQHFCMLKNKYNLTLCQSCLHTASENVVIKIHKEIRSGPIFCVFASVASILIERMTNTKTKRIQTFRRKCARTFTP